MGLVFGFAVCPQVVNFDESCGKRLNGFIKKALCTTKKGLAFVQLETCSLQISVFTNARFASSVEMSSQLRYNVTTETRNKNENIYNYSSFKSKQGTGRTFTYKLCAAVPALGYASTMRVTLKKTLKRYIPPALFTDSKCLFESLVEINCTTKKDF